jgi:hypothetical protein
MATDRATSTVIVGLGLPDVLAAVRDVEAQPQWAKEVHSVEVLSTTGDGLVQTARIELQTGIGSDTCTLAYEHADDAMSWHLVAAEMMKQQDGSYRLRELDAGTEVVLDLAVEHGLPAPGFIRRRVLQRFVDGLNGGLVGYLQG